MNKVLVITVAGTSTRFRQSVGFDVLKCLYKEEPYTSILDRQISMGVKNGFNKIIIVGGYLYSELESYLKKTPYSEIEIICIYNEKYNTWGSNYSLYLGLLEIIKYDNVDRIIFAEGDLVFDEFSFELISNNPKDVVTANRNTITAISSVVFYVNASKHIKYLYDSSHKFLEIKEPFLSIHNSGQVWSFNNIFRLKEIVKGLTMNDLDDTNLNIINKYFSLLEMDEFEILTFDSWYNCNTVDDYKLSFKSF